MFPPSLATRQTPAVFLRKLGHPNLGGSGGQEGGSVQCGTHLTWLAAPGSLPSDPVLSPGVDRKKPRKQWGGQACEEGGGRGQAKGQACDGTGAGLSCLHSGVEVFRPGGWAVGRAETRPPAAASLPGSLLSARHVLNTMGFPGLGCKSFGWGGQPMGSIWWVRGRGPGVAWTPLSVCSRSL